MIKHYEGELGTFDYDDEEFEIYDGMFKPHLHYIGKGKSVDLPKGCINTSKMFTDCKLPRGFSLGNFDTSNVINMESMFYECILPEGFTLGDKFDTSNVTYMENMFSYCKLPEGFTLGDKFDTSNVKDMRYMFVSAIVPEGFSLGDKFNTSNVKYMRNMFTNCVFPEGFTLGDNFDTSNVENMRGMFYNCKLPEGFTLGDKFDTSNVRYMQNMFSHCVFPECFSLGDKFDTSNVINMDGMFANCGFPEGMSEKSLLNKQKCLNNVYKMTLEKSHANVSCFTMDCLNDNIILLPENIFNGDKPSEVKIIRYPAIDYYSLCKLKAEYILEPNSSKCCMSPKSYISLGLDDFFSTVCILK